MCPLYVTVPSYLTLLPPLPLIFSKHIYRNRSERHHPLSQVIRSVVNRRYFRRGVFYFSTKIFKKCVWKIRNKVRGNFILPTCIYDLKLEFSEHIENPEIQLRRNFFNIQNHCSFNSKLFTLCKKKFCCINAASVSYYSLFSLKLSNTKE